MQNFTNLYSLYIVFLHAYDLIIRAGPLHESTAAPFFTFYPLFIFLKLQNLVVNTIRNKIHIRS